MLKRKRKSLAVITSLALLFAGIYQPVQMENKVSANAESVALTVPASAPETKNINLNVKQGDGSYVIAGINDPSPAPTTTPDPEWAGSYVYYGNYWPGCNPNTAAPKPLKWRVLDADTTDYDASKNHTMLLFSDKILDATHFETTTDDPNYSTSDLKTYLANDVYDDAFSVGEKTAIVASTKTKKADTETIGHLYEDQAGLSGDKLFALSAEEVNNMAYGFVAVDSMDSEDSTKKLASSQDCKDYVKNNSWWLRSVCQNASERNVGYVDGNGSLKEEYETYPDGNIDDINKGIGVAPAFNLNLSSVCFASQAGMAKSSTFASTTPSSSKEWNLTIAAGGTEFDASREGSDVLKPGGQVTVNIDSLGTPESTGVAYNQISAMLVDKNNTVAAYGKIGATTSNSAAITLPIGLARGEYTLKVFAEDVNSSATANLTDYASNMVDIPISVGYSVKVNPGAYMTRSGGAEQQTVKAGDAMTPITYKAAEGYYFPENYVDKVTQANGVTVRRIDDDEIEVLGEPTADVNMSLASASAIPKYTITVTKGEHGSVTPGMATIQQGEDQRFTITPDADYEIASMKVDGSAVTVSTSYTFTNVTANHTLEVTFKEKAAPTPTPTAVPTAVPTAKPTATPTPKPTNSPQKKAAKIKKVKIRAYARWEGNDYKVSWNKVSNVDQFVILGAPCGKDIKAKSVAKTVKGSETSAIVKKIAGKKLSYEKDYKVKVKAYKVVKGKKVCVGSSIVCHAAGKNNRVYTNAKKVTVSKKSVTLKKGKSKKVKAKIVKNSNAKPLLSKEHDAALRYDSTNTKIATVSAKGKIKAKKKGTCYVYITALNGLYTRVKVTVK